MMLNNGTVTVRAGERVSLNGTPYLHLSMYQARRCFRTGGLPALPAGYRAWIGTSDPIMGPYCAPRLYA